MIKIINEMWLIFTFQLIWKSCKEIYKKGSLKTGAQFHTSGGYFKQ